MGTGAHGRRLADGPTVPPFQPICKSRRPPDAGTPARRVLLPCRPDCRPPCPLRRRGRSPPPTEPAPVPGRTWKLPPRWSKRARPPKIVLSLGSTPTAKQPPRRRRRAAGGLTQRVQRGCHIGRAGAIAAAPRQGLPARQGCLPPMPMSRCPAPLVKVTQSCCQGRGGLGRLGRHLPAGTPVQPQLGAAIEGYGTRHQTWQAIQRALRQLTAGRRQHDPANGALGVMGTGTHGITV